jgi:hypothetical protein
MQQLLHVVAGLRIRDDMHEHARIQNMSKLASC